MWENGPREKRCGAGLHAQRDVSTSRCPSSPVAHLILHFELVDDKQRLAA